VSEKSTKKRRFRSVLAGVLSIAGLVWAASVPMAGWCWGCDLAANFVAWSVVFPVVAAVCAVLWGSRRARLLVAVAAVAQLGAVGWWMQAGRAAWDDGLGERGGSVLGVLQCNAQTGGATPDEVLALLRQRGAGVVALTEASGDVLDRLRIDPEMLLRYPYRDVPPWRLTNTRLILSAWPLEPLLVRADLPAGDPRRALRLVRVLHEDGPFVVLVLHPQSPRTPARWRQGNELLEVAIETVRERAPGEPLIVLADLNSTPTGGRSRRLVSGLGVRRSKPVLVFDGTYPAWLPWPLRAAIDDVWVSDEWRVAAWRTLEVPGSDHRAVEVELRR